MATTRFKSVEERINFACRNYFLTHDDIAEVSRRMKEANPGFELLDLRAFGQDARKAMSEMFAEVNASSK